MDTGSHGRAASHEKSGPCPSDLVVAARAAVGGWGQPITAAQVSDVFANGEVCAVGEIAAQRRPSELGPSLTPAPYTCI